MDEPEIKPDNSPPLVTDSNVTPITAEAITDVIAQEMPDVTKSANENKPAPVSEPVSEAEKVTRVQSPAPPASLFPEFTENRDEVLDPTGARFVDGIHQTDENGKPFKNRAGNFVRIKNGRMSNEEKEKIYGGRKAIASESSTDSSPKSTVAGDNKTVIKTEQPAKRANPARISSEPEKVNYETVAEMYLQTGYALAAPFLGDEFRPDNDAEHNALKVPLIAVLEEKGEIPLTPVQMFCLALIAHAGRKYATKPTVKEKVQLMFLKVRNMFKKKD